VCSGGDIAMRTRACLRNLSVVGSMFRGSADHSLLERFFNSWDAGWRGELCQRRELLFLAGKHSPLKPDLESQAPVGVVATLGRNQFGAQWPQGHRPSGSIGRAISAPLRRPLPDSSGREHRQLGRWTVIASPAEKPHAFPVVGHVLGKKGVGVALSMSTT